MTTVSVRYIVDDVDAAIEFYCGRLGFHEDMHPAPTFAMLSRGDLRLVLSAPGGGPGGGGQPMPDGTLPEPGGWNRFQLEVQDLQALVERLREGGATFRNDIVTGVGGKPDPGRGSVRQSDRVVRADPPGGVPRGWLRAGTRCAQSGASSRRWSISQRRPSRATKGAPEAWLVFDPRRGRGASRSRSRNGDPRPDVARSGAARCAERAPARRPLESRAGRVHDPITRPSQSDRAPPGRDRARSRASVSACGTSRRSTARRSST